MDNLSCRLKNKIDVYSKVQIENELGEMGYKYEKLKSIYCEIIPTGGNVKNTESNYIYAEVSHRITIRLNAIDNLANDMYFMYGTQRFDIKFSQPNYKYKDSVEIFCNLVVE